MLRLTAWATLLFGLFSLFWPLRSIALYQGIMAFFNWRVEPINRRREIFTTRFLGGMMVAMSVLALWLMTTGGNVMAVEQPAAAQTAQTKTATATFAGGCFWCMQSPFDETPGVVSTTVGYTGGNTVQPTYDQVSSGKTGHAEAIAVIFDPSRISYEALLEVFWRNVNPTTANGQFTDKGTQYRTAIFYHDEEQKRLAEASREKLAKSGKFDKPIVTEIVPASVFYPAEEYHQHYYKKSAVHYNLYKIGSGRADYLKKTWGSH